MNFLFRNVSLYVVVTILGVCWLIGFDISVGGPPDDPEPGFYLNLITAALFIAVPWFVALRLLLRSRTKAGVESTAQDAPAALLAAAVATLPEERRDWGEAMTAELDQVQDRADRWRFAAGCARTALLPPQGNRVAILLGAAVSLVAMVAAGVGAGFAVPAMRVLAVTFVGLVGVLAVVSVTRSGKLRPPSSSPVAAVTGVAGIAACIGVTGWFLVQFPIASLHLRPVDAVFLAVLLAVCLGLTLFPPKPLNAERVPQRIAVVLAMVLAAGLVVVSQLGLRGVGEFNQGVFPYVFGAPVVLLFVACLAAAWGGGSFRSGALTAAWTALLTTPAFYAIAVMQSAYWYRLDSSLIYAGDAVPIEAVGENIRNFTWGLILFPIWWLPFGMIGAAIGSAQWLRRRSTVKA